MSNFVNGKLRYEWKDLKPSNFIRNCSVAAELVITLREINPPKDMIDRTCGIGGPLYPIEGEASLFGHAVVSGIGGLQDKDFDLWWLPNPTKA